MQRGSQVLKVPMVLLVLLVLRVQRVLRALKVLMETRDLLVKSDPLVLGALMELQVFLVLLVLQVPRVPMAQGSILNHLEKIVPRSEMLT